MMLAAWAEGGGVQEANARQAALGLVASEIGITLVPEVLVENRRSGRYP